jgi:hypothetical protein
VAIFALIMIAAMVATRWALDAAGTATPETTPEI